MTLKRSDYSILNDEPNFKCYPINGDCRLIKNKNLINSHRNFINYTKLNEAYGLSGVSNRAIYIDFSAIACLLNKNMVQDVITIIPVLNGSALVGEVINTITIEGVSNIYETLNYLQNSNVILNAHISNLGMLFRKHLHINKFLPLKYLISQKIFNTKTCSKQSDSIWYNLAPQGEILKCYDYMSVINETCKNTWLHKVKYIIKKYHFLKPQKTK